MASGLARDPPIEIMTQAQAQILILNLLFF
jgi:hypothetical protein